MKIQRLFYFIFSIHASAYSQDTLLINHLAQYKHGKIDTLISPSGKYILVRISDRSWHSVAKNPVTAASSHRTLSNRSKMVDPNLNEDMRTAIRLKECRSETFAGLSRSLVKTSVTKKHSQSFPGLSAFIKSLYPDADMIPVVRSLPKPYAQRAVQEDKFVTVENVFLLAYSRERDNDYHLILTDSARKLHFNAEVSGLPPRDHKSYHALNKVRNAFKKFPGHVSCGQYVFFKTPIPIRAIAGCLFFDTDHPAGTVGPTNARPATAWELHPVLNIEW